MTCRRNHAGGGRVAWASVFSIALMLPAWGCSSVPGESHGPLSMFSADAAKDEALRKRVEADKFPTAQQAGIASQ